MKGVYNDGNERTARDIKDVLSNLKEAGSLSGHCLTEKPSSNVKLSTEVFEKCLMLYPEVIWEIDFGSQSACYFSWPENRDFVRYFYWAHKNWK